MPQRNMRPPLEPAIANIPSADIAARFGRRLEEPAVIAGQPKWPLKVKPEDSRRIHGR